MRLLRSGRALKKDDRIGSEFIDHLPARSAWGARYAMVVRDDYGLNLNLRS